MPGPQTVFVVDDDPDARHSLKWLLESVGLTVRVYASAAEFLNACTDTMCGCLLLDVRMPDMSGLELQERLIARGITLPVIIVTGHAEVPMAVKAMKNGAVDFLQKPFNEQVLLERVDAALRLDVKTRAARAACDSVLQRLQLLTRRERQVLELVVIGKPTKQIARRLGLSPKTIEIHRSHMMEKMRAGSLAELVRVAISVGIQADLSDAAPPPDAPGPPPPA